MVQGGQGCYTDLRTSGFFGSELRVTPGAPSQVAVRAHVKGGPGKAGAGRGICKADIGIESPEEHAQQHAFFGVLRILALSKACVAEAVFRWYCPRARHAFMADDDEVEARSHA